MLETISLYIIGGILVTLGSGAAPIVLHAMFGPVLPPNVQRLSDMFSAVFKMGAAVFLCPAQIVRHIHISIGGDQPPTLPPSENK